MPTAQLALEQAKAARNGAHEAFHSQLVQIQEDLAVRGVGGRVADRAGEALAEAKDIAGENKGVVAGTIAALALWYLRDPIFARLGRLWADEQDDTPERNVDDE